MIFLEPRPDRRDWASFGWALGLVAGAGLAAAGATLAPASAWLGLLPPLGMGGIAAARPELFAHPYDLWNRAAGRFGRLARRWVLAVLLRVVFYGVGRSGSVFERHVVPGTSAWRPRVTLVPEAYPSAYDAARRREPESGWLAACASLAARPRNRWTFALLPFLLLLRALDRPSEHEVPSNLYTLY